MKIDQADFTDKASKDPALVALYEQHRYLDAYATHTDRRVKKHPRLAVGGKWEELGAAQADFLKSVYLQPYHRLLDFGCGTGRFARQIVPFLFREHYVGVDISLEALRYARVLAMQEGWDEAWPQFLHGDGAFSVVAGQAFDVVWAWSVCTHLPPECIARVFAGLGGFSWKRFYFSYTCAEKNVRTGLKQFAYHLEFFESLADQYGYHFEPVGHTGRLNQSLGLMRKSA